MSKYFYTLAGLVLTAAAVSAQPAAVQKAEAERVAVVAKVKPTVVAVFARGGQGGGTGVLINDEGYALTNFHVVQPTGPTMQCGLADGVLYDAVLVGWDKVGDVALIKLLPKKAGGKFPFSELGDSDKVHEGDWSIAMGNPFLLATDFTPTVTFGLVSGVHRYQPPAGLFLEYTDCIQIDTSINPGNSGGPLFNMKGEVIGINGRGSFDKRARINSGVGYAISINQIKNFMGHLKAGLDADHASLGALVRTEAENFGLGKTKITSILEESDAYRRGLYTDDELVSFADRQVHNDNHYKNVLGLYPRGWRVPLEFRRGDKDKKEILVRLMGVQKKEVGEAPPANPKQPPPKGKGMPPVQGPAAKFYDPKPGFVNFYFNRQEKNRLLAGFKKSSDFTGVKGTWTIDGTVRLGKANANSDFALTMKEGKINLKLGAFPQDVDPFSKDIKELRAPNGSGGFMPAMYVWRVLLMEGDKGFPGECVHGGTEPFYPPPTDRSAVKSWSDQRVMAEVLSTRFGNYMTKWFFSPADQKLLGFELRMQDQNEDPVEVYFSDYRAVDGKQLPHRIQVKYEDHLYGTFNVTSYKFGGN